MRYYSTQRPIGPGSYPQQYGVVAIHNFEQKTFCKAIGREAWGYIDFDSCIPEDEAEKWELTRAGKKVYWSVTTAIYYTGRITVNITSTREAVCKPENSFTGTRYRDIYIDWFDSREEAEKFAGEARRA